MTDSIICDSELPDNEKQKQSRLSIYNFGSEEFKAGPNAYPQNDDIDLQSIFEKEMLMTEKSPEPRSSETNHNVNTTQTKKDPTRNLIPQQTELSKKPIDELLIITDSPKMEKNNSALRKQKT